MSTRETATRLIVARVVKDRLAAADRDLRETARTDFDVPGVRDIGVIGDEAIGSVQLVKGRTEAKVTDPAALLAWVKAHHADEVVTTESVRSSYLTTLLNAAKRDGVAVDPVTGEIVPGIEQSVSEPTLNVKPSEDAPDVIARALAEGRLSWEQVATAAIEVAP